MNHNRMVNLISSFIIMSISPFIIMSAEFIINLVKTLLKVLDFFQLVKKTQKLITCNLSMSRVKLFAKPLAIRVYTLQIFFG